MTHAARMKQRNADRRDRQVCIQNPVHGKAYKGGRCRGCWAAKLASDKRRYDHYMGRIATAREARAA